MRMELVRMRSEGVSEPEGVGGGGVGVTFREDIHYKRAHRDTSKTEICSEAPPTTLPGGRRRCMCGARGCAWGR